MNTTPSIDYHPPGRTIPEINDYRLGRLLNQLTPVLRVGDDTYRAMAPPKDPRTVSYIWSAELVGPELHLLPHTQLYTYHSWGYYGLFKPSLAEVMAQVQYLSLRRTLEATHFWLDADSVQIHGEPLLHRPDKHNRSGYHRARVHLLAPPLPDLDAPG